MLRADRKSRKLSLRQFKPTWRSTTPDLKCRPLLLFQKITDLSLKSAYLDWIQTMKLRLFPVFVPVSLLLLLASAVAQTPPVKVDSDTISGLGARNIGSAAMSGRISAVDAVQEGQRLTIYV